MSYFNDLELIFCKDATLGSFYIYWEATSVSFVLNELIFDKVTAENVTPKRYGSA